MVISVESSAIKPNSSIPREYTCDGRNISPPLRWTGVPDAKSYAVTCHDPDAPSGHFTHWIIYDIPASVTSIGEGIPRQQSLPDGSRQGISDAGRAGYSGPCPPRGAHRYIFTVYAVDEMLGLRTGLDGSKFMRVIEGHVLAKGELIGVYAREG
ncbi:MAG TPA: YbhB/YbcL family Raf kinase inhibitor-like protein [Armatimonadetes bacterium]|nr:YbhB/YbcL family Raf kinase inhibitor-like protein [Armatimonadota bacterium]